MATIVEKYPFIGNTGQCLILGPRERLVYPFNIGSYSEVRFGMYYSYTRTTGSNLEIFTDTAAQNAITNSFYIGFGNNNTGQNLLPGSSGGYDFIGFGKGTLTRGVTVQTATDSWINGGNSNNDAYFTVVVNNTTGAYNIIGNSSPMLNYFPTKATGITNYASLLGASLSFPATNTFQFQGFNNANTYTSDVSVTNLRNDISAKGTSQATAATGFFTTGCVNSFNNLMTPNSLIIYNPMLNTCMRIHNLVVDRYA